MQPPGVSGFQARRARLEDAQAVFDWRNDAYTRAASGSQEVIAWEDHASWFSGVLADEGRRLYIIERAGTPVAVCRFDPDSSQRAHEVSINLDPVHRGKGLAAAALQAGIEQLFREKGHVPLAARIRPSNIASSRVFTQVGFTRVGSDGTFDHYEIS